MGISSLTHLPETRDHEQLFEVFSDYLKKKDHIVFPLTTRNVMGGMGDARFLQMVVNNWEESLGNNFAEDKDFGDILSFETEDYVLHGVVCFWGLEREVHSGLPYGFPANEDDPTEHCYDRLLEALDQLYDKYDSDLVRPFKAQIPGYGKMRQPKSQHPALLSRTLAAFANSEGEFDLFAVV